ncbi:MAG TPA: S9 family peptidase, partial [Candidatus Eisenbacteria bacterium]|nr:S9 family peptidase [Candidatus Eisenbacteria bacterium]
MSAPSVMTIGPGDVLELRFPHSADLSPDGRRVVQAVSTVDHEAKEDRVALHLLDIESGVERPLTTGVASDTCPAWSPDGSRIAFVSTRTGQPQLFVIAPDGGEARQLTSLPHGVAGTPAWSPDGSLIAFSALGSEERRDPALPYRVTRTYYRLDGLGYIEDALLDIHVVDAAGGDPRRLTRDGLVNGEPRWTPDGTALAYLAGCEPDSSPLLNRVRLVDLHGNVRDIYHPAGLVTGR